MSTEDLGYLRFKGSAVDSGLLSRLRSSLSLVDTEIRWDNQGYGLQEEEMIRPSAIRECVSLLLGLESGLVWQHTVVHQKAD